MKTDESLVFDYLNPDFSILGVKKMAFVDIKPEQSFYLKHRVIHWINQVNNSIDPENNFETMRLKRYLIGNSKTVVVSYGTRNTAGNLRFNYDGNNNFINFSFEENKKLYKNDEKFPKSSSLFEIDFKTDNKDEIVKYRISRSFDDYDGNGYNGNYIDDLKISYIFNVNGKREQDIIRVYGDEDSNNIIIDYVEDKQNTNFEDFFHEYFDIISRNVVVFLEMYPQFSLNTLKGASNFEHFYLKFKELYELNTFDDRFKDNIKVIEMLSV